MSIVKRSIDAETAARMIEAAVAKSREIGKANCIAVVNEAGQLKAFHAMDGAARNPGSREHPPTDVDCGPHLASTTRQVGDGSAARHAATAAAAERA